ncbi:MAG: flagellin [Sulfurimonas sp.]|nr:MAG: flagellin [Sulfurimonas sp.]
MGFRINTNVAAMNAHRNATMNNVGLDKSLNALSSGLRINNSADDAAGLAIANKMSAQSQGLGQAIRNGNDGIGLVQTADGAIKELVSIAQRMRVLAVQSSNDTLVDADRVLMQKEIATLITEETQITSSTEFNDKKLLNGAAGDIDIQIGHDAGQKITIVGVTIAVTANSVSTKANAQLTIAAIDTRLTVLAGHQADLGSKQNAIESAVRNISTTQVNIAAAESQLRDVDFAAESANFAKHNILAQSGSYAMSQANAVQQNVLRLLQ